MSDNMDLKYYEELDIFHKAQLEEIKIGLDEGLNVKVYANEKFGWDQMMIIREGLVYDLDVEEYANTSYDYYDMETKFCCLFEEKMTYCRSMLRNDIIENFYKMFSENESKKLRYEDCENYVSEYLINNCGFNNISLNHKLLNTRRNYLNWIVDEGETYSNDSIKSEMTNYYCYKYNDYLNIVNLYKEKEKINEKERGR